MHTEEGNCISSQENGQQKIDKSQTRSRETKLCLPTKSEPSQLQRTQQETHDTRVQGTIPRTHKTVHNSHVVVGSRLTPKRSTVSTIAKSPPMRNIRKSKAEATVKKLNVEKAIANISLSPLSPTDDSTQDPKDKNTTVIDLVDTSEDSPPQVALNINPNCTTFGQDIVILSSDSQDSFHTASVNSAPTRNTQHSDSMDWTPDVPDPEWDINTQKITTKDTNENSNY